MRYLLTGWMIILIFMISSSCTSTYHVRTEQQDSTREFWIESGFQSPVKIQGVTVFDVESGQEMWFAWFAEPMEKVAYGERDWGWCSSAARAHRNPERVCPKALPLVCGKTYKVHVSASASDISVRQLEFKIPFVVVEEGFEGDSRRRQNSH